MYRLFRYLLRITSKPFDVIAFRVFQAVVLEFYRWLGLWRLVTFRSEWMVNQRTLLSNHLCLFVAPPPTLSAAQLLKLKLTAEQVLASKFEVFGHPVPPLEHFDFSTDWRFQHSWPAQYFKRYQFYLKKQTPYDVKFPWELSRLHYLVPVLSWQLFAGFDLRAASWILSLLQRWRTANPVAYSVNWYPMEASMRTIYFVMLLDLVKLLKSRNDINEGSLILDALARQLLTMLHEHAHFVWVNREYTDVRGNHFTANLVALQLADQALGMDNLGSRKWGLYAGRWTDREILLQFCGDGVNFEKSCGYHKLVLELFMLSVISSARAGKEISQETQRRLLAAAQFSDALTRPDGVAAGFGDTDDALGLPFLLDRPRSHGAVVELVRAWFDTGVGSHVFYETEQLAALMLVGRNAPSPLTALIPELLHFPSGGFVVVRNGETGFFLMIDIGEVGMLGRGGHGHNDLLAFELCIDGVSVVVDPGCSGYTADLDKKTLYRSTAAHSTVQLFNEEIARFAGHWEIHNEALPCDVSVVQTEVGAFIRAGHMGYARIQPGAYIRRMFDVNAIDQRLVVRDEIEVSCQGAEVRWHFPIGEIDAQADSQQIVLNYLPDRTISFKSSIIKLDINQAPYSSGYGQEVMGNVIVGMTRVSAGKHVFNFQIEKAAETGT